MIESSSSISPDPFVAVVAVPFRIRHPITFASYTRSSTATDHDHLINTFSTTFTLHAKKVKHVIIIAPRGHRIIIMFPASIVPYASGFWIYPPPFHSFLPYFLVFFPCIRPLQSSSAIDVGVTVLAACYCYFSFVLRGFMRTF